MSNQGNLLVISRFVLSIHSQPGYLYGVLSGKKLNGASLDV